MMIRLFPAVMVAAAVVLAASPALADGMVQAERLLVGKTNIYCVKAPCPWLGIWRGSDNPTSPEGLLWSAPELPQLVASEADAQSITRAWRTSECIEIEGYFTRTRLHVDKVTGPCS